MAIPRIWPQRTEGAAPLPASPSAFPPDLTSDDPEDGARTHISGFARFVTQLAELQRHSPFRAKELLADVASELRARARTAADGRADRIGRLAEQFQGAADSGDLTRLRPGLARAQSHQRSTLARQAYGPGPAASEEQALVQILDVALQATLRARELPTIPAAPESLRAVPRA